MKTWTQPVAKVQHFEANESVSACGDKEIWYKFVCRADPGSWHWLYQESGAMTGLQTDLVPSSWSSTVHVDEGDPSIDPRISEDYSVCGSVHWLTKEQVDGLDKGWVFIEPAWIGWYYRSGYAQQVYILNDNGVYHAMEVSDFDKSPATVLETGKS